MIISSELTGKTYKTVEECVEDEKKFKLEKAKAEAEAKIKKEKIAEAEKKAVDAINEYFKLVKENQEYTDLDDVMLCSFIDTIFGN